jgi:anaerobic magnesium-protoporphyrin IX monomethyl ester cyclase
MPTLDDKKILLVHPLGYRTDAANKDISRMANIMPPIGLVSIAAYLERRGICSAVIDCYARPDSDRFIRDHLLAEKPAFLGLSCTTSSFLDGVRVTKFAKSILPNLRVVFGGPHVSALKERVLQNFPEIDFCVVGEGEQTLADLIEDRSNKLGGIQGLVYQEAGGGVCFTGHRTDRIELDTLPLPAYEKLHGYPETYKLPIFNYPKTPNTSCVSSRGCPYACSYCDRSVFRRSFRHNSAQYMYEHLRYLKERFGVRHVSFYDDQFTFDRKRIEDFSRMLIDRPLGMTFNCAARAEHIDEDLLRQLKAAGCWMMSLGIETGDEALLAQHRSNSDLRLLADKIHLIKQAGIRTKGLLMMGLPGETKGSIKKSMDYVFSLPVDDFNLSKFTPFPGSPIYQNIHQLGVFDEDWEKMDCMHFLFIPQGMEKHELEELFKRFYKTHFMRPKVIWDYVTMTWRSPDSWRRFVQGAGDFIRFARSNERIGYS